MATRLLSLGITWGNSGLNLSEISTEDLCEEIYLNLCGTEDYCLDLIAELFRRADCVEMLGILDIDNINEIVGKVLDEVAA